MEKQRKAIYATIWTILMAIACYATITLMPSVITPSIPPEWSLILFIEVTLLSISLIILTMALKLRKETFKATLPTNQIPFKLSKVKKTLIATVLTMLLAASVYATIWLLTVKVPVVYREPFEVWFSDETNPNRWYPLHQHFGQEVTLPPANLTNRAFDIYLKFTNNGKRAVTITVNITAYNVTTKEITPLMGFQIQSSNLTDFKWGTIQFSVTVKAGETVNGTVTYHLSNNAPLFQNQPNMEIAWKLWRSEPTS
ncbi:MAG: hypothetical protein NZ932_03830 [Candidatus Bathyarchaeota archaeon]|nr:hypothetical protein [Candidatus Bathyarchaeota archaeon]MDW8022402.1 hypothetical protein [Nitrososphaerota archaeon]